MRSHDHDQDEVLLCPECHRGRWVIGTADGSMYLFDLDGAWVAPVMTGDAGARLDGARRLILWSAVRADRTLPMSVCAGAGAPVDRVRTYWVSFAEPVVAAPSFVRACWERGLNPQQLLDEAAAAAADLATGRPSELASIETSARVLEGRW